jgi:hypothetical protein
MDATTGVFHIRGDGGSARPMTFLEVRDQMLYTEGRLHKVTLFRFELATIFEVNRRLSDAKNSLARFDVGVYKMLLADVCDLFQADVGLLRLLHEIGSDATLLNPLMDMSRDLNARMSYDEEKQLGWEMNEARSNLFNKCARAQDRLNTLFGRLDI